MKDEVVEQHESYGMIGVHRLHGGSTQLFGTSVRHDTRIAITIKRGEKRRDLSNNWYYGREELIEVELSPTQFAEMITSMNFGDGVPCTIKRIGRERMPDCPEIQQRALFEEEFKSTMRGVGQDARDLIQEAREILGKKSVNKGDREKLLAGLNHLLQMLESNMPFIQGRFNEAMDKTVLEAKTEVEAFVAAKIQSLGIESLQQLNSSRPSVKMIEQVSQDTEGG